MKKWLGALAVIFVFVVGFFYSQPPKSRPKQPTNTQSKPTKKALLPSRAVSHALQEASNEDFEQDPKGSLSLSGQVVDEDGAPLAGAVIGLSAVPPRQTTSDAKGWFFFEGLVGRTYLLEAITANAYGSASVLLNESSTPVTLMLQRGASVSLTVLDELTRAPIPDAEVSWGMSALMSTKTDAQGKVTIGGFDAVASLYVVAEGYSHETLFIQLGNNYAKIEERTLLLKKGAEASGVVLSPTGEPVANARVSISPDFISDIYSDERHKILSDSQGRWAVPTLSAGVYTFSASAEGFARSSSTDPLPLDGKTPRTNIELRLKPGATITGKVVTPKGEPVIGAIVTAEEDIDLWSETKRDYTDDAGNFQLSGMPCKPLRIGAATPEGLLATPQKIDLTSGSTASITLTLDITGSIRGVVVAQDGQPIADAKVGGYALSSIQSESAWRMKQPLATFSDPDGNFELKGVIEGEVYSLGATHPKMSAGDPFDSDLPIIKAKSGDQQIKIVLQKLAKITGVIHRKEGGAPKEFKVSTGTDLGGNFTDKDGGRFVLEDVVPGKRAVYVSGPGFLMNITDQIEIKPGETADVGTIIVSAGRRITGRVTSGDNPVANASVFVGTYVSGDGSRLQLPEHLKDNRTTSADDGSFEVAGLPEDIELIAVAEHPTIGRSQLTKIPKGDSDQDVTLELLDGGILEGVVTFGGGHCECFINAKDGRASFSTGIASSGKYRFGFLTPGSYEVVVTNFRYANDKDPSKKSAKITIEAKKTTKLNIDVPLGVSLSVAPIQSGKIAKDTAVNLIAKSVSAKTIDELEVLLEGVMEDQVRNVSIYNQGPDGNMLPALFGDVPPGSYTVCVYPTRYPDPKQIPIHCEPLTIPGNPEEQSVEIKIPEWGEH